MATPIISLNPLSPFPHISPSVISASALTPSTTIPVSLIPTVPTVPTIASISTSLSNTVMGPIYPSIISYQDVNSDHNLRRQVTEYFFDKLSKNWLKYHYLELYQLVNVNNGTASLIKDMSQAETNNKNIPAENSVKYTFIVDNYINKNDLYKLISRFRKMNNLNWWDLKKYSDKVRHYILHKISKAIKNDINKGTK